MDPLELFVPGTPIAQGSKRHVGNGVLIESAKKLKPWRNQLVAEIGRVWDQETIDGPAQVVLTFVMPRPKRARLHQAADKRPDLDKLTRAVFDALTTAKVVSDDSRIVTVSASKRLARLPEPSGCHLLVRSLWQYYS